MNKSFVWCLILCFLLLAIQAQRQLDQRKVVFALNCGSYLSYRSNGGFIYQGDANYEQETKAFDYRFHPNYEKIQIKYTNDDLIYKSERTAENSFSYYLPIDKSGIYVLILQFVELTVDRVGARVFNIKFGDFKVVEGLDIFDRVGRNTAYEKYIEFELKDDEIFYQDHVCSNAYRFKDKKLVLEFEKTEKGSPKVDGIILFKGSLKETNYQDLQEVAEERKSEIELSKQVELDRRIGVKVTAKSDDYIEKIYQSVEKENYSLLKLLFKGPGLVVSIAILFLILIVLNMETESYIRIKKGENEALKNE